MKKKKKKLYKFKKVMAAILVTIVCMNSVELHTFAAKAEKTENQIVWDKSVFQEENVTKDSIDIGDIEYLCSTGEIEAVFAGNGRISMIMGKFTEKRIQSEEDAAEVLNMASSLFGEQFHANVSDITVKSAGEGEDKEYFYRYSPTVNGMSVSGSEIIISTYWEGEVNGLTNYYEDAIETMNTVAMITETEAEEIVREKVLSEENIQEFLNLTYEMAKIQGERSVEMEDIITAYNDELNIRNQLIIYAPNGKETPKLLYAVAVSCDLVLCDVRGDIVCSGVFDRTYYVCANEDAGEIYMTEGNITTLQEEELAELSKYIETYKVRQRVLGILLMLGVIVFVFCMYLLYKKKISHGERA